MLKTGQQGFDIGSSKCSGAFDSAFDRCIFGTGPLPLTTFSEKSWCKWAICDEWSQVASGGAGGGPDIGGVAPGAKGPGYGLGGDTRDFDQYDGTNILCGETLLEMFGMIDCRKECRTFLNILLFGKLCSLKTNTIPSTTASSQPAANTASAARN